MSRARRRKSEPVSSSERLSRSKASRFGRPDHSPLDRAGGLAGHVVDHAVDSLHLAPSLMHNPPHQVQTIEVLQMPNPNPQVDPNNPQPTPTNPNPEPARPPAPPESPPREPPGIPSVPEPNPGPAPIGVPPTSPQEIPTTPHR